MQLGLELQGAYLQREIRAREWLQVGRGGGGSGAEPAQPVEHEEEDVCELTRQSPVIPLGNEAEEFPSLIAACRSRGVACGKVQPSSLLLVPLIHHSWAPGWGPVCSCSGFSAMGSFCTGKGGELGFFLRITCRLQCE